MCPLLLRRVNLVVIVVSLVLQVKGKRKCRTVLPKSNVVLKFVVRLLVPANALLPTTQILLLLWQLNLPEEKREEVGETEKLLPFSKAECHSCIILN